MLVDCCRHALVRLPCLLSFTGVLLKKFAAEQEICAHLGSHGLHAHAVTRSYMHALLRFLLIALMVQAIPSASLAADAKGLGRRRRHRQHISPGQNRRDSCQPGDCSAAELRFRHPLALCMTEADPYEVQGKRCSVDGQCEEAIAAKVWLNKGNGRIRRLSRRYTVDFSGQHLGREFMVNYRKNKKPFIGE